MPNADSAEIFRRLSAVEQSINSHVAECVVRNEDFKEWRREAHSDLKILKADKAKQAGVMLVLATLASMLGSGGVFALFKVLGGQ